jgi:uncharacterized protein YwgA
MNRYQLATLVRWAGTLHSRKRLQKVIFLLQAAGCDLQEEFILHHYGPYSPDVASLTDKMVHEDLLREDRSVNTLGGRSFSYKLTGSADQQMEQLENDGAHSQLLGVLAEHEDLARRLLQEQNLQKLEYAATIAFFHARQPGEGWARARESAAKFKQQSPQGPIMLEAEQLALEVVDAG